MINVRDPRVLKGSKRKKPPSTIFETLGNFIIIIFFRSSRKHCGEGPQGTGPETRRFFVIFIKLAQKSYTGSMLIFVLSKPRVYTHARTRRR